MHDRQPLQPTPMGAGGGGGLWLCHCCSVVLPAGLLLQGTVTQKTTPCLSQGPLFPISFSLLGTYQILCLGATRSSSCWIWVVIWGVLGVWGGSGFTDALRGAPLSSPWAPQLCRQGRGLKGEEGLRSP